LRFTNPAAFIVKLNQFGLGILTDEFSWYGAYSRRSHYMKGTIRIHFRKAGFECYIVNYSLHTFEA